MLNALNFKGLGVRKNVKNIKKSPLSYVFWGFLVSFWLQFKWVGEKFEDRENNNQEIR